MFVTMWNHETWNSSLNLIWCNNTNDIATQLLNMFYVFYVIVDFKASIILLS